MNIRSNTLVVLASTMLLLTACSNNDAATETTNKTAETVTEETNAPTDEKMTAEPKTEEVDDSTEQEEKSEGKVTTKQEESDIEDSTQQGETPSTEGSTQQKEAKTEDSTTTVEEKETKETAKKAIVEVNPIHKDFLQNQLKTARNGMTEGVPFESGKSLFEEVTAAWGEPTTKFSNNTNYIEYAKNGIVEYAFGIGRGDRLYDVRTFVAPNDSFKLSDISFEEIIKVIGKPAAITTSGNDQILNYKAGANTLKFVGPASTKKLHHISIYNQKSSEPMGGRE